MITTLVIALSTALAVGDTVRPGIEVLLSDSLAMLSGKRVGLITNHTGRDREGRRTIDLVFRAPGVKLVAPLPHGIDLDTVYSAAVSANAAQPEAARAFLARLAGEASRKARIAFLPCQEPNRLEVAEGVLGAESAELMQRFFAARR